MNCKPTEPQETVFDRVVHIEEELVLEIPQPQRWCERLNLDKRRVNIGDCELYVEEEGNGVPIVLLHGGPGGTHHSFHPYLSRVRQFARLIYYDQRGCGLSDYIPGQGYTVSQAVDDLEKLRKALHIDQWVVLGWSYGGLVGQCYTLEYPERVKGLVLVTSTPALPGKIEGTRQYDYISEEEKQRMREIYRELRKLLKEGTISMVRAMEIASYNRHLNGDWKRQSYYRPTKEEMAMETIYDWKHDTNFNRIVSQDLDNYGLDGAFASCPVPTLILESKWDLTWKADKPEILHQNHPGSELVIFEKSGHAPFKDEPKEFDEALLKFIGNLPNVSGSQIE